MEEQKKKKEKGGSFLSDGLSINETRMSALILVFIAGAGFSFYQVVKSGDIAEGLLSLLMYLIMAISGINISESVVKGIAKSKKNSQDDYYDSQG
jgi:hypothetical protein